MDTLLKDIAIKVGQEMDSISQLMSFLHLLPSNHIPPRIDAAQHDSQARALANLLQKIILENKNTHFSEKSREMIEDLTVQALKLVSSSPDLQDIIKREASISDTLQNDKKEVKMLNDYLSKVAKVGCRNISISHQTDKLNASILFRTIEKCNTNLHPQKLKMKEALRERREALERGQIATVTLSREIEKKLQETKAIAFSECDVEEEGVNSELGNLVIRHEQNISELRSEFDLLQSQLSEASKAHLHAQQELLEQIKVIEEKNNETQQQHCADKEKRESSIVKIEALLLIEQEERRNLEHKYALVEANREIEEKEGRLLQHVLAMEAKADSIINQAAITLQKIFRGNRDRVFVSKLKKKKKKKGKKKGESKGKNKRASSKGEKQAVS